MQALGQAFRRMSPLGFDDPFLCVDGGCGFRRTAQTRSRLLASGQRPWLARLVPGALTLIPGRACVRVCAVRLFWEQGRQAQPTRSTFMPPSWRGGQGQGPVCTQNSLEFCTGLPALRLLCYSVTHLHQCGLMGICCTLRVIALCPGMSVAHVAPALTTAALRSALCPWQAPP